MNPTEFASLSTKDAAEPAYITSRGRTYVFCFYDAKLGKGACRYIHKSGTLAKVFHWIAADEAELVPADKVAEIAAARAKWKRM